MKTLYCKAIQSFTAVFYFTALALILFTPYVCDAQQIAATPADSNFHKESDNSVILNVTVTNEHGDYIMRLGKANFALYDGKAPQEFTFLGQKDVPVSINILLDVSGSINDDRNKKKADLIKDALTVFLKASNSSNEYFLTVFNNKAQVIGGAHTAETVSADVDKILSAKPHGQTAFYDACFTGVEQIMRGVHSKRVVFIISDGQDNSSRHKFEDVLRLLKETNVTLYAINIMSQENNGSLIGEEYHHELQAFVKATGGIVYLPAKIKYINVMAGYIAEELRNQYALSFKPASNANENKWHRLEVKVSLPSNSHPKIKRVVARAREGYYANRIAP